MCERLCTSSPGLGGGRAAWSSAGFQPRPDAGGELLETYSEGPGTNFALPRFLGMRAGMPAKPYHIVFSHRRALERMNANAERRERERPDRRWLQDLAQRHGFPLGQVIQVAASAKRAGS